MSWRALGLRPWLWQRVSAAYMGLFLMVFSLAVLLNPPAGFVQWRAFLAQPVVNVATVLFWGLLLVHAWVGMRNVLMDYVSRDWLRLMGLTVVGLFLGAMGAWMLRILLVLA